jgi:hypothetical protein
MNDENEEDCVCEAFNQLFYTIKELQKIKNRMKDYHNSALEKCKKEIENLLHPDFDESKSV